MSKNKNKELNFDAFDEDLQLFQEEFRDEVLATDMAGCTAEELHDTCRDIVLPYYPLLEYCYIQHGLYHAWDYNVQPTASKYGRRVAGAMWSIINEIYSPQSPQVKPVHVTIAKGARFQAVGDIFEVPDISAVKTPGRKCRSEILAKYLQDIAPGNGRRFEYQDELDASRDQSLLKTACTIAGWYEPLKAGLRPYSSRITCENGVYYLTVFHLWSPQKEWKKTK